MASRPSALQWRFSFRAHCQSTLPVNTLHIACICCIFSSTRCHGQLLLAQTPSNEMSHGRYPLLPATLPAGWLEPNQKDRGPACAWIPGPGFYCSFHFPRKKTLQETATRYFLRGAVGLSSIAVCPNLKLLSFSPQSLFWLRCPSSSLLHRAQFLSLILSN